MSNKKGIPKPLPPLAPKNLSPRQFVTLYRGMRNYSHKTVDTNELGKHWTADKKVASTFATQNPTGRDVREGVVVKARVHPDSIVKPYTEEWHNLGGMRPGSEQEQLYEAGHQMNNRVILPPDSHENEKTLRPGSKVNIAGMNHITDVYWEANKKTKKMKFKKPGKI